MLPLSLVRKSCKLKVLKLRLSSSFVFRSFSFFTYTALHFCIGLVTNYFNFIFLFLLFLYFLARSFWPGTAIQFNFTQFALETCFDLRSISAQFRISPTHCVVVVVVLLLLPSHHHPIAWVSRLLLYFVFALLCVFVFFSFSFYFVQFDELLSSPFVKCAPHTIAVSLARMPAQLHCTAGEYVRVECVYVCVVCVCVCRLMDSSSSKWW